MSQWWLVLASQLDALAKNLVADLPAVLLTPRDLCTEGWRLELGAIERSFVVAEGVRRSATEIRGVLNLLPYVCEHELIAIQPADRSYVSAEVTAFLYYLLAALPCPVINNPSVECLTGPGWRREQWAVACRRVGIATGTVTRNTRSARAACESHQLASVTVLGDQCVEGENLRYAANVRALADLAHLRFLQVNFVDEGTCFHSVQLTPDLHNPSHWFAIHRFIEDH